MSNSRVDHYTLFDDGILVVTETKVILRCKDAIMHCYDNKSRLGRDAKPYSESICLNVRLNMHRLGSLVLI